MKKLKKILGIFTAILAISYFGLAVSYKNHDAQVPLIFLGILMVIFTVLLLKPSKKDKFKDETTKKKHNEKPKTCTMNHINGLPIAENIPCIVTSLPDTFEFISGSMKFELEKSKITDMCIKTDREIQQQYVSSIGRAAGSALLFGPIGAIIGGKAKKKTVKKEIHYYFIITYKSDEIKYIGFEIIGFSMSTVRKFIIEFNNSYTKEKTTYQL